MTSRLHLLIFLFAVLTSACATEAPTAADTQPGAIMYPPVNVAMKVKQVSPHVYFVQGRAGIATDNAGFISNAGFVVTPDGVVVFDALGTPSLAAKLLGEIRRITTAPIRTVVVSHYHADHIYGLQVFKDQGAQIIAPEGARDYLSGDVAESLLESRRKLLAPWVNGHTRLVVPDIYVSKEHVFELGGVSFKLTPLGSAHSEGDMVMLVEPDNVLLSGDIIFEQRIPFIGEANTRNWLNTLNRMRNVKVAAIIPGHGPMARSPGKVIAATYRYLAFLRKTMGEAVDKVEPFSEAYEKVDWGEFAFLPAFDEANRRNAYNVYLSIEQEFLEGGN
jgi:glyoxylase-like metal-dependent hydrolase (beta-lactamase superfamily II)